jgi:hypothetical protein
VGLPESGISGTWPYNALVVDVVRIKETAARKGTWSRYALAVELQIPQPDRRREGAISPLPKFLGHAYPDARLLPGSPRRRVVAGGSGGGIRSALGAGFPARRPSRPPLAPGLPIQGPTSR